MGGHRIEWGGGGDLTFSFPHLLGQGKARTSTGQVSMYFLIFYPSFLMRLGGAETSTGQVSMYFVIFLSSFPLRFSV